MSPETFDRIWKEAEPTVAKYLYFVCRHRETAQDLMQDTRIKAWRYRDSYRGSKPANWFTCIAKSVFLDWKRLQTGRRENIWYQWDEEKVKFRASKDPSPLDQAIGRIELERVMAAVESLTPKQQASFRKSSRGNGHLHRDRQKLRKVLSC